MNKHFCNRCINLFCVYYDNIHIISSLWRRNVGTNLYQCDRILIFIFHILFISFLSLFIFIFLQKKKQKIHQIQNKYLLN